MEIGIFGCSHSFGTGNDLLKLVFEVNADKTDTIATKGYGAILSTMFPNHNFTLYPAIAGGNKEILQNLTSALEQDKYDMYIVQTTSWYRFTLGVYNYTNKYFKINDNLKAYIPDVNSYHNKELNRVYPPNFYLSFLPHQKDKDEKELGTGLGSWVYEYEYDKIPNQFKEMAQTYIHLTNAIIKDHFSSTFFLNENYMLFNLLHMLSLNNNIWYFHWNPPFGMDSDFRFITPTEKKNYILNVIGELNSRWNKKDHKNKIYENDVFNFFVKTYGYKNYIANILYGGDTSTHVKHTAHEKLVDVLLQNNKFKEQLWK